MGGVVVSALAHAAIITALLLAGRPAVHAATEFEQRIAEYLFPKDRAPKVGDESLAYLRVPGGGSGTRAAEGEKGDGSAKAAKPNDGRTLQMQRDPGTAAAPNPIADQVKMAESMGAFIMLDVDSAAVRDPRSAAPAYPKDLEAKGVEGVVKVRFVVDSTGLVDMSTVVVLEKTNDTFARAVRVAMPEMRFRPAYMGPKAVRQLSEQEFDFRVKHTPVPRDTIYRVIKKP
jgi:TonB family protein